MLKGRILLNLDSEELGVVYMGCAGGAVVTAHRPLDWEAPPAGSAGAVLTVKGLRGGHSGGDIHENRGNALKLLARVLKALASQHARLADLSGGDKHNAIPREARAVVALPADGLKKAAEIVAEALAAYRTEFPEDPNLTIACEECAAPERVMKGDIQASITGMLLAFPSGVLAMSRNLPNLVETSTNLAAARVDGDALVVHNSPRSSNGSAIRGVIDQIDAISRLAGAVTETRDPYPGWQPNPDSRILNLVEEVHAEVFGHKPQRRAIHAGLETGIIGEKIPGIDMVSFGPEIKGAHSPDEGVKIDSVAPFYTLLHGVLAAVAKGRY
jgi:dipeptidase D